MTEHHIRFTTSHRPAINGRYVDLHVTCRDGKTLPVLRGYWLPDIEAAAFERIHASHDGVCDALDIAHAALDAICMAGYVDLVSAGLPDGYGLDTMRGAYWKARPLVDVDTHRIAASTDAAEGGE